VKKVIKMVHRTIVIPETPEAKNDADFDDNPACVKSVGAY